MRQRGERRAHFGVCALIALLLTATTALAQSESPDPSIEQTPAPWVPSEFGALAFTADGSFATIWKIPSKDEAEARVRDDCLKYQRGTCEVVSFGASVCAAIATGEIAEDRKITYAGGGTDRDEAEEVAMKRCTKDKRTKDTCELRTTVCGNGR